MISNKIAMIVAAMIVAAIIVRIAVENLPISAAEQNFDVLAVTWGWGEIKGHYSCLAISP